MTNSPVTKLEIMWRHQSQLKSAQEGGGLDTILQNHQSHKKPQSVKLIKRIEPIWKQLFTTGGYKTQDTKTFS